MSELIWRGFFRSIRARRRVSRCVLGRGVSNNKRRLGLTSTTTSSGYCAWQVANSPDIKLNMIQGSGFEGIVIRRGAGLTKGKISLRRLFIYLFVSERKLALSSFRTIRKQHRKLSKPGCFIYKL